MTDRRNELGEFLRARRDALRPHDVGMPAGGRRRVAGLRREELAALSGISAPYLARLEQGRDRHPSPQVIDVLARALRLDAAAHAHLRVLAGHAAAPGPGAAALRPGLRHLIDSWTHQAAFVMDRFGTVLAANPLAGALHPAFAAGRNVLRFMFLDPAARRYEADWELIAERIVADIRATSAAQPDDPGFAALVAELSGRSPEFARLWARHDAHEKSVGIKRIVHPRAGAITLNFECFTVNGAAGLALFVLFAEPGTPDEGRLAALRPQRRMPARSPSHVPDANRGDRPERRTKSVAPPSGSVTNG